MSTLAARTEHMPECVVLFDSVEVPARYDYVGGAICLEAVKINGYWCDPCAGFTNSQIRVWENDIADVEHSISQEG